MFYFIEKCDLYSYADDNSLANSGPSIDDVLENIRNDSQIAIQWFEQNGMQANPDKFHFMIISRQITDPVNINLIGNVTIKSESSVKVLGIIIDRNLNFSDHISSLCKKGAR